MSNKIQLQSGKRYVLKHGGVTDSLAWSVPDRLYRARITKDGAEGILYWDEDGKCTVVDFGYDIIREYTEQTDAQKLSDSLLAACRAAGIEIYGYVAQDEDGEVWHYEYMPRKKNTIFDGRCASSRLINHPPYADDWQESLLEWVEPQTEPLSDVLARHEEAEATGIEALVCADIAKRQRVGMNKYGTTVADNPLELRQWLNHAYEECLDMAVYLKKVMTKQ